MYFCPFPPPHTCVRNRARALGHKSPILSKFFNHCINSLKVAACCLFLQYECVATKQVQVSKGSTISTIKYSLGRLMRTDANWLVRYNTEGRGGKIGGRGSWAENIYACRKKRVPRTLSKYVARLS